MDKKNWLLQINEEKLKVMHLGRVRAEYQYHLGKNPLATKEAEKGLGILRYQATRERHIRFSRSGRGLKAMKLYKGKAKS